MKKRDPTYVIPVKILMIVVCIFSVLLALQTASGVIVITTAGVATYSVFLNPGMKFGYLFAEGGLSMNRIPGGAKRRKIFNRERDDTQIAAPVDSFALKDYEKQGMRIKDSPSGRKDTKVYALIYQRGLDHFKMPIEPSERMTRAMRRAFPRKLVTQDNGHIEQISREQAVEGNGIAVVPAACLFILLYFRFSPPNTNSISRSVSSSS